MVAPQDWVVRADAWPRCVESIGSKTTTVSCCLGRNPNPRSRDDADVIADPKCGVRDFSSRRGCVGGRLSWRHAATHALSMTLRFFSLTVMRSIIPLICVG